MVHKYIWYHWFSSLVRWKWWLIISFCPAKYFPICPKPPGAGDRSEHVHVPCAGRTSHRSLSAWQKVTRALTLLIAWHVRAPTCQWWQQLQSSELGPVSGTEQTWAHSARPGKAILQHDPALGLPVVHLGGLRHPHDPHLPQGPGGAGGPPYHKASKSLGREDARLRNFWESLTNLCFQTRNRKKKSTVWQNSSKSYMFFMTFEATPLRKIFS